MFQAERSGDINIYIILNWLFEEMFLLLCAPRELADIYF